MKPAAALLGLVLLLDTTFAAEQSCVGRCGAFDRMKKCQCDSLCVYYDSCCDDFATLCPKRARGDTFEEEEYVTEAMTTVVPTVAPTFLPSPSEETTQPTDPDVAPCSGRPFDAFLQLKNGSIYAFRGEYFFELDDTSILPGYPKLIQDVWGITGPIDAAFTRVNCQGKSYIFKGNQYWRFDGDVMDEDYPRNISVGFADIPNGIDAAFAVPASSHRGKEKASFFKGDRFYLYEFKHQPSHAECVDMTRSSPSVPFLQYADLFCDQSWDDFFSEIFGDAFNVEPIGPRLISEHWSGLRAPVDAAILGRAQVSPKPTVASPRPVKRRPGRRRRPRRRGKGGRYRRHALFDDLFGSDDWFDSFTDLQEPKSTPAQKVYFFKGDKYYRVNLQTQRVDFSNPPYPRPIAKYWLGCKHEEKPDISKAEKR